MAKTIISRSKLYRFHQGGVTQRLQNLLVIDFEATCEKNVAINEPEIIEFPCVVVSTENWKVQNIFHEYVKPRINPILSTFCTDLTGIMQETIENEQHFPVVLKKFQQWLETNGYAVNFHDHSAFVTSGDWDLKVLLPQQCARDNLAVPDYFKQWIDLKKAFFDATEFYPKSLKAMHRQLELPQEGRLHSGLDDSYNMARIIESLAQKTRIQFEINSHNAQMTQKKY